MSNIISDVNLEKKSLTGVLVSITAPAYNEEENIGELCERIKNSLTSITDNYEIVIVDNASTDKTLEKIKELADIDEKIKYVLLSKNFGHQGGLLAGMQHCCGDVVVTMDADLQHPPEVIPRLLDKWLEGFDVVGTNKKSNNYTNVCRRIFNKIFYKFVGFLTGIPLSQHQSDFRLLDRVALDALIALPEKEKFIRGLTHWIGFKQTSIEFEPEIRKYGRTKFSVFRLVIFTIHGLVSFTALPLRLITLIGLIIAIVALMNTGYFIISWLINSNELAPPGWWTLAAGIYFLGGLQLVGIGIIGEYLAQNLNETRKRPSFIVKESTATFYKDYSKSDT